MLSWELTLSNSFSISVALITRGPRTAYSICLIHGFMFSNVKVGLHVDDIFGHLRLRKPPEDSADFSAAKIDEKDPVLSRCVDAFRQRIGF